MKDDRLGERDLILLAEIATDAAAEVQDAIVRRATYMGRSGIVVSLRVQARELAPSPIGHDQIRSLAFSAAADDIAWGRAPLEGWSPFALGAARASDAERAAIRAGLPQPDRETVSMGEQIVRGLERRLLARHDAADGALGLSDQLLSCATVQASLWDDPRLTATPQIRLLMHASIAPLQQRLDALRPPRTPPPEAAPRPEPSLAHAAVGGWRRFLPARR